MGPLRHRFDITRCWSLSGSLSSFAPRKYLTLFRKFPEGILDLSEWFYIICLLPCSLINSKLDDSRAERKTKRCLTTRIGNFPMGEIGKTIWQQRIFLQNFGYSTSEILVRFQSNPARLKLRADCQNCRTLCERSDRKERGWSAAIDCNHYRILTNLIWIVSVNRLGWHNFKIKFMYNSWFFKFLYHTISGSGQCP